MHRCIRHAGLALFFAGLTAMGSAQTTPPAPARALQGVPDGRLPRNVVPTRVALDLKIDPKEARFSGQVSMAVKVSTATRTVWMHGKGLEVHQASFTAAGGKPIPLQVSVADPASGVLRLSAAQTLPAGTARLDLQFEAPFGKLQGAYRVKAGGEDYVLTQMESQGARVTFPGFDEPSFKQPWEISLEVPEAAQAVANTQLRQTVATGPGWKKLVFAPTEALPSYLLAFAVGPWDIVDAAPLPPNAVRSQPLPLRGIAPKGQGPRMRYALENTAAIVAAEEAYFGIPYPFDKLDILAAPDFAAGAMENAGLIVYRDLLLYADENSSTGQRQQYWGTHAHELAHQWFGDYVTMPWWDDIWLNEAFATWMAAKVVAQLQPGFHADRGLMEASIRAMAEDSLVSTRRIHEPIKRYTDIASAFDGITYSKGGAVLSMFERNIGADAFREAIRSYMRRHARGNATSGDLIDALASASADPAALRRSFATFLDQPGVPLLRVQLDCSGPRPTLNIAQQRYLPVGSKAPSQGLWEVPMCVRWGDAQGAHAQCNPVRGRQTRVALQASSCPAWVMPNASGAGYYRFALAPADAQRLEAHFGVLDEREQRAYADSVDAAFQAGALGVQDFLRASAPLAAAPARETATAPLRTVRWLLSHLADTPERRQALQAWVRQHYGPRLNTLGTQARQGDKDEDSLLRRELLGVLADLGRDPEVRRTLALQGRRVLGLEPVGDATPADGQLHPEAVSANHRGLALRIASEDGNNTVFEALLAQAFRTEDSVLRTELLSAAAASTSLALRERARDLALSDKVRRNEIALLISEDRRQRGGGVPDPAALEAGRRWMDAHFDSVAARVAPAGAGFIGIAAAGLCSEAEAAEFDTRYAPRVRDLEGGPHALAQTTEAVRLCGSLRTQHAADAWVVLN